jgi:hypothetical protein
MGTSIGTSVMTIVELSIHITSTTLITVFRQVSGFISIDFLAFLILKLCVGRDVNVVQNADDSKLLLLD